MKWLVPGMNVKRWLVLLFFGVVGFSLGVGLILLYVLRALRLEGTASTAVAATTLQFIPRTERAVLIIGIGLLIVAVSLIKLSRSLLSVFLPSPGSNVADVIYRRRKLPRGPRVVALGGGSGLSTVLRGLKEYTSNLTAIVTVAQSIPENAGAAGQDLGILTMGNVGDCIIAMSDEEPLMGRLFMYRFGEGSGLEGHSFGNLFIMALAHITGSFEAALREVGKVLAVRGQILPSTAQAVRVVVPDAGSPGGDAPASGSVQIESDSVMAYAESLRAIREADLIVLGPGNVSTALLPNLMVPGIAEAVRDSAALKVFVGNVASQAEDPTGEDVLQQARLVQAQAGEGLFDYVLANDNLTLPLPPAWTGRLVRSAGLPDGDLAELRVVEMDLIDTANPTHHDAAKLSEALMKLYYDQAPRRTRPELTQAQPALAS